MKLSATAPLALAFAMSALPLTNALPDTNTVAPVQPRTASEQRADLVAAILPSVVSVKGMNAKNEQVDIGSGFVYKANDGYIITNAHVVDDETITSVQIILPDERTVDATIVGFDKTFDIAVLKLTNPGDAALPQTVFDTANTLRVANDVIAIGTPFGFRNSVSTGIVSAFHRNMGQGPCDDFIQIDAAVNPGNSGGPLFNEKGAVVGVNSMIYSSTHNFAGIAFSIPIAQATKVADLLIAKGKLHWGYMGISMQEVDAGIVIRDTTKGQAAQKAGLAKDDIIVALNGEPVKDGDAFSCKVAELQSGTPADITYLRNGQQMHAIVTLGERPAADADKKKATPKDQPPHVPKPRPRPHHAPKLIPVPEARPLP